MTAEPARATEIPRSSPVLWGSGGVFNRLILPQLGWLLLILVVGAALLWPISQLYIRAAADGGSAFYRATQVPYIWETVRVTFLLALASSVIAVVVGTLLAWCASMLPQPVRRVGQLLPLLPMVMPLAAKVTGFIFLLSPQIGYLNALLRKLPFLDHLDRGPFDIYSLEWIIVLTGLGLSSFVYLFVLSGLQAMGHELEAAAAASGASAIRRLFTITIPLLRPSIVFASSVIFLLGMGQFTVPLLLGRTEQINVLTTEMFYLTLNPPVDYGLGAVLGLPILITGIVLVVVQKYLLGDQRRYVVVSARSRNEARVTSWWSATVILLYTVLTTVLPFAALAYVSVSPFWTSRMSVTNLTLRHWAAIFDNSLFTTAIWTSVTTSVISVTIVIPLGFACAYALLQSTRILRASRAAIEVLVMIPIAFPASLKGFGILFAFSAAPFMLYGTTSIIIITYVTLMITYATRLQLATLMATGREFTEASYACGAGPVRTFLQVLLPLTRTGIVAAAVLTFVLLSHEFSASLMVRSVRTQVMGSVLYDVMTLGIYPQAAVLALLMVTITFIGMFVAVWAAGLDSLKKM